MLDWTWFIEWNYWHWLILGAALLLLELFGTAGLLLWTGIAALLTALVVFMTEPGIYGQWELFALFSIGTTLGWFRLNKRNKPTADVTVLNRRTLRCIGTHTTLLDDVKLGKSRVRIEDTVWVISSDEELKAGDAVKIVSADGTTLRVKSSAKNN